MDLLGAGRLVILNPQQLNDLSYSDSITPSNNQSYELGIKAMNKIKRGLEDIHFPIFISNTKNKYEK